MKKMRLKQMYPQHCVSNHHETNAKQDMKNVRRKIYFQGWTFWSIQFNIVEYKPASFIEVFSYFTLELG